MMAAAALLVTIGVLTIMNPQHPLLDTFYQIENWFTHGISSPFFIETLRSKLALLLSSV